MIICTSTRPVIQCISYLQGYCTDSCNGVWSSSYKISSFPHSVKWRQCNGQVSHVSIKEGQTSPNQYRSITKPTFIRLPGECDFRTEGDNAASSLWSEHCSWLAYLSLVNVAVCRHSQPRVGFNRQSIHCGKEVSLVITLSLSLSLSLSL